MAKVACAIALVSGAVPLSGCSQIPVANTYPAEYQPRMQSVAHWRALAVELVGAIEQQRRVDPALAAKPIHVQPQQARTPFSDGFHTLLTAELLNRGLPLALAPEGAMILRYTTQVVGHKADRRNRPAPGLITGVAAAAAVPAHVLNFEYNSLQYVGLATGAGAVADLAAGAITDETNTEMIFSASIFDGEIMRFRATRTFYVNDRDFAHYEPSGLQRLATRVVAY